MVMTQNDKKPKDVRFAFFGSSDFSVTVLEVLDAHNFLPTLIVTMPDAPAGRGLAMVSPRIKKWAEDRSIEVIQPIKLTDEVKEKLKKSALDISIVASYGKIIPYSILSTPRYETLNVHPSLLPKYRGPTPIQSQILADDREMGVSIMVLDEKVDHGPIVYQERFSPKHWPLQAREATTALAHLGGVILSRLVIPWIEGIAVASPQNHEEATHTKKFAKEDGNLTLIEDEYKKYVTYCAFEDTIGTFFYVTKKDRKIRVKVNSASYADSKFILERVTPEGGREMSHEDFLRGMN